MRGLFAFIAILCVFPLPAYAYIDPGSASIILQAVIGAIAAGAATMSIYYSKIKGWFSKDEKLEEEEPEKS